MESFRNFMAGASPSYPRQCQAGDPFCPRNACGDVLGCAAEGQEDLSAQASSLAQQSCPDAYTVIPPNSARRNQLQKIAKKELEELERWKKHHRPGPINLTPQKLGGRALESEVRQKQQLEHSQSKYRQKLKMAEYEKIKREAEEADLLKKKAIQREKANKLEEKRRQEECLRKQMLDEDNDLKTVEFLSRLDLSPLSSCPSPHYSLESTAWARSQSYKQIQRQEENLKLQKMKEEQQKKAEWLEFKQQQDERARTKSHQNEQLRVNNAFLDRLQSQPCNGCHSGYLGNVDWGAYGWDS